MNKTEDQLLKEIFKDYEVNVSKWDKTLYNWDLLSKLIVIRLNKTNISQNTPEKMKAFIEKEFCYLMSLWRDREDEDE